MTKSRILAAAILLTASSLAYPQEPGRGLTAVPDDQETLLKTGRQYLVVVGISRYERWPTVPDAVNDVREVRDILRSRYRVDQCRELYDAQATKAGIIKLLEDLQTELKPEDSVLILYSGHGHLDRKSETGFWIPVNAGTDVYEQLNWLPHVQLKGLVSRMPSTHVLVISDSCFAGDLLYATRSLPEAGDSEYLQKAYSLTSRLVMTSGATEPVPADSTFASQLKSALRRNEEPCLDSLALYSEIRRGMKSTIPLLGALAGAGHQEGACFLLFLRAPRAKPAPEGIPPGPSGPPTASRPGRDAGVWLGGGLEGYIPVFLPLGAFTIGPAVVSHALYEVETPAGILGAAFQAGAVGLQTAPGPTSDYLLLSFPFAVDFRYRVKIGLPWFFCVDMAVGMVLSRVLFNDPAIPGITNLSLFLSPELAVGLQLGPRVRISAGVGGAALLFSQPLLVLYPVVRVEYAIVRPRP